MFNRVFLALRAIAFGSQRSIPGLDGLRAVSICFVFAAHLSGTRGVPYYAPLGRLGQFGVRVFFVISGYLITSILLKELDSTQRISLGRFYFRRALRLLPAAYFLLAVAALAGARHVLEFERWDLLLASIYALNFYDARGWPVGHFWSLAVEEQFYLIWPFALSMLGQKRSVRCLLWLLALAPVVRLFQQPVAPLFNFLVWTDTLGCGCLLALVREKLTTHPRYSRLLHSRWFFLVPLVGIAAAYTPSTKLYWLLAESVMNFTIVVSVDWAMRHAGGRMGRILNSPSVSFVGVLSYSLYLWQQFFLNRHSASWYCAFPVNLLLAVAAAMLSYVLIETPFLRLRVTIERIYAARQARAESRALVLR